MQTQGRLGRLIRDSLKRRSMTVARMAELAGMSTSGAYKVIAGEGGMPTEATLRAIAVVLGMEPAVLWDAAALDHKPEDDVLALFVSRLEQAARDMTPAERKSLRTQLALFASMAIGGD